MQLSKRLTEVIGLVKKDSVVCDIGTDHGYAVIELVRKGTSPSAIAMDVRPGPLERAKEHVLQEGLSEYIDIRLSDGLQALQMGEADGIILAGMGGNLICNILKADSDKVKKLKFLILQPQSEIKSVRKFLRENGLWIESENMVLEDGKFYPMMRIDLPGNESEEKQVVERIRSALDISWEEAHGLADEFGPFLLRDKNSVLRNYLSFWAGKQQEVLKKLDKSRHKKRYGQVLEELARIQKAKAFMGE